MLQYNSIDEFVQDLMFVALTYKNKIKSSQCDPKDNALLGLNYEKGREFKIVSKVGRAIEVVLFIEKCIDKVAQKTTIPNSVTEQRQLLLDGGIEKNIVLYTNHRGKCPSNLLKQKVNFKSPIHDFLPLVEGDNWYNVWVDAHIYDFRKFCLDEGFILIEDNDYINIQKYWCLYTKIDTYVPCVDIVNNSNFESFWKYVVSLHKLKFEEVMEENTDFLKVWRMDPDKTLEEIKMIVDNCSRQTTPVPTDDDDCMEDVIYSTSDVKYDDTLEVYRKEQRRKWFCMLEKTAQRLFNG